MSAKSRRNKLVKQAIESAIRRQVADFYEDEAEALGLGPAPSGRQRFLEVAEARGILNQRQKEELAAMRGAI